MVQRAQIPPTNRMLAAGALVKGLQILGITATGLAQILATIRVEISHFMRWCVVNGTSALVGMGIGAGNGTSAGHVQRQASSVNSIRRHHTTVL